MTSSIDTSGVAAAGVRSQMMEMLFKMGKMGLVPTVIGLPRNQYERLWREIYGQPFHKVSFTEEMTLEIARNRVTFRVDDPQNLIK